MKISKTARSTLKYLYTAWRIFALIVIIGHLLFAPLIGGSALNGLKEDGHYYLIEHGEYTEVSEFIWNLSLIWEIAFFIFIPLYILIQFLTVFITEKYARKNNTPSDFNT